MLRPRYRPRPKVIRGNCHFCDKHTEPDYKEVATLKKFITERGKLVGKDRTGVCSKHQRALTKAVKWARYVALMPFVVRA